MHPGPDSVAGRGGCGAESLSGREGNKQAVLLVFGLQHAGNRQDLDCNLCPAPTPSPTAKLGGALVARRGEEEKARQGNCLLEEEEEEERTLPPLPRIVCGACQAMERKQASWDGGRGVSPCSIIIHHLARREQPARHVHRAVSITVTTKQPRWAPLCGAPWKGTEARRLPPARGCAGGSRQPEEKALLLAPLRSWAIRAFYECVARKRTSERCSKPANHRDVCKRLLPPATCHL